MKIEPLFAWYDFWIGWYWNKKKNWLYILPLPMIGIVIKFTTDSSKESPKEDLPPPSPEFLNSLGGGGSIVIDCQCGRVHFGNDNGDFEEFERERYEENLIKHPDQYFEHQNEFVGWYEIDGRIVVDGCICSYEILSKYERFIWRHRHMIKRYINNRSDALLKEGKEARI